MPEIKCVDPLAISEIIIMGNKSLKCTHTPNKSTNSYAHERAGSAPSLNPSMIESMTNPVNSIGMLSSNLRNNPVLPFIISDIVSVIDFMSRVEYAPDHQHVLVNAMPVSMTHAGIGILMFQIMMETEDCERKCHMHVLVEDPGQKADIDWLTDAAKVTCEMMVKGHVDVKAIASKYVMPTTTLIARAISTANAVRAALDTEFDYYCITVTPMTAIDIGYVEEVYSEKRMASDGVPCCPPGAQSMRLANKITGIFTARSKRMTRPMPLIAGAVLNSFTVRIRPIRVCKMCYDCRIARDIASGTARMMVDFKATRPYDRLPSTWSDSYAEIITVDAYSYISGLGHDNRHDERGFDPNRADPRRGDREVEVGGQGPDRDGDGELHVHREDCHQRDQDGDGHLLVQGHLRDHLHVLEEHVTPKGMDPAQIIIWMLLAEDYSVNSFTLSWPGMSINTFAHAWAMMERFDPELETAGLSWTVPGRTATGYRIPMGIMEPADTFMFQPGEVTVPHIATMEASMSTVRSKVEDRGGEDGEGEDGSRQDSKNGKDWGHGDV